ncbi:MAG TPA: cell division protein SepF [Candidatus Blautia intestinigallinarum]|nr:cell division protein SepF [Candidatus Blautia intestinigallinarum]
MSVLDKFLDAIKLNDDFDDDDFLDDDILDDDFDEIEEKPRKKFFEKFSKKKDDDFDDDFDDFDDEPVKVTKRASKTAAAAKTTERAEKPARQASRPAPSKITPMRNSKKYAQSQSMEVCVIKPSTMEDTREIADSLVDNSTVVLNLEGMDVELAQRIIDFTSGACYSLGGRLQKVSSYIFILTPYNVDITGDFQNILDGAIPSMRAGY